MKVTITIEIDDEVLNSKTEETKDENVKEEPSIYGRYFDEGNPNWSKNREKNLMFLLSQQNYANIRLRSRGYLFLNEVYVLLSLPKTETGKVVGWIYDEHSPIGDNFVDFGIYNMNDKSKVDFVNGKTNSIFLDFNVDGNILDRI